MACFIIAVSINLVADSQNLKAKRTCKVIQYNPLHYKWGNEGVHFAESILWHVSFLSLVSPQLNMRSVIVHFPPKVNITGKWAFFKCQYLFNIALCIYSRYSGEHNSFLKCSNFSKLHCLIFLFKNLGKRDLMEF